MDALILTRARYRRRYGNDMPEASMPSRFLEEIPSHLLEPYPWPAAGDWSLAGRLGGRYIQTRRRGTPGTIVTRTRTNGRARLLPGAGRVDR